MDIFESVTQPLATRSHRWGTKSKRKLLKQCLAEFTACLLFHFIGSASPTAVTNASCLSALVYATADVSGAHLNPCVTLVFLAIGSTTPLQAACYMCAQFLGCIVAATVLIGLSSETNGCFTPSASLTPAQVFGWEAICTYAFLVPLFSVVWLTSHKEGYGSTGPLYIGLALYAAALGAGSNTGGALNPARALASPTVFDCSGSRVGYYIIGELFAATLTVATIVPMWGSCDDAWYIRKLPAIEAPSLKI